MFVKIIIYVTNILPVIIRCWLDQIVLGNRIRDYIYIYIYIYIYVCVCVCRERERERERESTSTYPEVV